MQKLSLKHLQTAFNNVTFNYLHFFYINPVIKLIT